VTSEANGETNHRGTENTEKRMRKAGTQEKYKTGKQE
jgi:hypothetical protein